MKRVLFALLVAAVAGGAFGLHSHAEEEFSMKSYYLALLYKGPNWTAETTEATQKLQEAHLANIGRLAEEGHLLLAGPFGDEDPNLRGLFIFETESIEKARELCRSDPAIKAGRLRAEVHTWWAVDGITYPGHSGFPKLHEDHKSHEDH